MPINNNKRCGATRRCRLCYRQQNNRSRRDADEAASRPRPRAVRADTRGRASGSAREGEVSRPRETAVEPTSLPSARLDAYPDVHAYPPWYHSLHTSHCIMNCWGSYERPQKQYVADGSISSAVTRIGRSSRGTVPSTTEAEVVAWYGRSVGASRRAKRNGARWGQRANHGVPRREVETTWLVHLFGDRASSFFSAEFLAPLRLSRPPLRRSIIFLLYFKEG